MFEPNSEIAMQRQPGQLNEHQQSRLRVTCQYIDKLLSDMEDILHAASSSSPFPRYLVDLNPAQMRLIEDHIRRLRSQLIHSLTWQHMKPSPAEIPATRAVLTNLTFVDIAIEELKPHYMRGFGPVPDDAVSELNGVVHELRSLVTGMERYLKQELDRDFDKRLRQLERTGFDVVLLRFLEQIATRNGLVEFAHQFFERELLPRFEKARSLREASITRKIGAMRDAIMAALDSNLHREKRNASPASPIVSNVESRLRVVTGEVGEQHTVLGHAFRTLGETPDAVIETVTDKATSLMRSSSQHQVSPLQFSEWIHEAVNDSIHSAMETLRNVGKGAVEQLQHIAKELGRNDAPSQDDFEAILREMPRFEMAASPKPFDGGPWRFWKHKVLRCRIRASLRQSIGSPLKEDLHLYGMALSQWSGQIVRKLERLINSYADAYRMQIHRFRGTSDSTVNPVRLQADLELLRNWRPAAAATLTDTHA